MTLNISVLTIAIGTKSQRVESSVIGRAIGELLDALHAEFPSKIFIMNMEEGNYFLDNVVNDILQSSDAPTQIYNYRAKEKYEYGGFSSVIVSTNVIFCKFFESHFDNVTDKMINRKLKRRTRTYQRDFLLTYSSDILTVFDDYIAYKDIEFLQYTHRYHFELGTFSNGSLVLFQKICLEHIECECRLVKLNHFDIKTGRWNSRSIDFKMPSKSFNFCRMNYFTFFERKTTESVTQRLNQDFLDIFAQHYNIQLVEKTEDYDKEIQFLIVNGKQYLQEKNLLAEVISEFHMTSPLTISNLRFAVTRGLSYTPAEKMVLPFDEWTWILIIGSIVAGFIVILFLAKMISKPLKRLTLGSSNFDQSFNLVRIFFGVDMVHVPLENCARFFIMIFMLYCIVIRTAYQGKMFEFMTSKVTKSTPQTIEELLEKKIPLIDIHYDDEKKKVQLHDAFM